MSEAPDDLDRAEVQRAVERALEHRFGDPSLLETALRHSSHAHELGGGPSNERLEFLGDAVIGLVVAHELFLAHPEWEEGDLTRALHRVVEKGALADLARRLDLGDAIALGKTERSSGGAEKTRILGDAMEAVIGALYLDAGLEPVRALALRAFAEAFAAGAPRVGRDPKTELQEAVIAPDGELPVYVLEEDSGVEGDDDRFTVSVSIGGDLAGTGVGRSKRIAEREAAAEALARLGDSPPVPADPPSLDDRGE